MPRPNLKVLAIAALPGALAAPVAAHEFWIEPLNYQVAPDGNLVARLVNGSYFDGINIAYFPNRIVDFTAHVGSVSAPIVARAGTSPALQIPAPAEGLVIISYQSTASELRYDDYETFERFSYHKDLESLAFTHEDRGFTRDLVTESYTRFSKSLFAVGDGSGADIRVGYETEFVLLANPYSDDVTGGLPVQLFYGEDVRADEQIELFARLPGDAEVSITYHRTNADGIAMLPVAPGMEYMIDAVVLRIPSDEFIEETGMQWESLWANTTFLVPAS